MAKNFMEKYKNWWTVTRKWKTDHSFQTITKRIKELMSLSKNSRVSLKYEKNIELYWYVK